MWTCKCSYKSNSAFINACAVCGAAMPDSERYRIYSDVLREARKALRRDRLLEAKAIAELLLRFVEAIISGIITLIDKVYGLYGRYSLIIALVLSAVTAAGMIYMGYTDGTLPYTQADGTIGQSAFTDSFKYKNRLLYENLTFTGENDKTEILSKSSVREKYSKSYDAVIKTISDTTAFADRAMYTANHLFYGRENKHLDLETKGPVQFFNILIQSFNEIEDDPTKQKNAFEICWEWFTNVKDKLTNNQ